jgi:hypothetical protein
VWWRQGWASQREIDDERAARCLPLEEEDRGENRLAFYLAKTGLPFGPGQRREKKNYFLVTYHFLSSIY